MNTLRAVYRKTRWIERVFLVLLGVYLLLRWTAPGSLSSLLAGLAVTLVGFVAVMRWARLGIRSAVWRLRNRLVVAYILIAVVPIALILVLAGIACYIWTGQIAVYLVSGELSNRAQALSAPALGLLGTPPGARQERIRWMAPYYRERFPGLELVVSDGTVWRFPESSTLAPPPPGHASVTGLVLKDGLTYLWAHAVQGQAQAVILVPLTRQMLNGLASHLGVVTIDTPLPAADPASQPQRAEAAPSAGWYDMEVLWASTLSVADWGTPGQFRSVPLGITTRPSALLRTVFGQETGWGSVYWWFFLIVGSLFLFVEVAALVIGISLTRTITRAVHGLHEGTQRVMRGDFSHRIGVRGNDQLADLGRSFNRMTENLERLLKVEKEKERLQSELEIASEVQNQLYPKSVPSVPGLELTAYCSPARMVSGDYYDYLGLLDAKVALAIGDVSGKGISAALLMATVQSCLRTQIRACLEGAALKSRPIEAARLVAQLNDQLFDYTPVEKFATFYFGIYDDNTGLLSYTNAGHPPPIVVRDGQAIRLETNGMVVGAFPFAEYGESQISLQTGDLLVCFTDGITEPENEYGEMFGEERLADLVVKHSWRKPREVIETVLTAVRQWSSTPDAQDDMTMLVARRL